MVHDAYRQIGYIQQALSQNRKPLGILIGAGCPMSVRIPKADKVDETEPIIPDVIGITKLVTNKLKGSDQNPSLCDRLIDQLKADGDENPNIENLLSHLRALRQVAGSGKVRDFVAKDLDVLDSEICKTISSEVNKELPSRDSPYHNLAVWARSIPREKPIHVFTTNYDLLIEQAFEESACPYFDGFIGSKKAFFDLGAVEDEELLHPRWCRLWKIHGSLNWKLDREKKVVRGEQVGENESHLIYPSHLKYVQSRKMPYLAMMDRLKGFIIKPYSILFVSGYSFSDDHINDIIVQSLKANPTAMTFALLFGCLEDVKYKKARECAMEIANLSLIAFDQGIIGRQTGSWILKNEDLINEIPAHAISKESNKKTSNGDSVSLGIYEIKLGDFENFGQFLREMSNSQDQRDDEN